MNILNIDKEPLSINYHKTDINTEMSYQPDLNELFNIYNECPDNVFSYDTSKCIKLISDENIEYPLYQYKAGINIKYLKILNDDLIKADSDILLAIDISDYATNLSDIWQNWIKALLDDTPENISNIKKVT